MRRTHAHPHPHPHTGQRTQLRSAHVHANQPALTQPNLPFPCLYSSTDPVRAVTATQNALPMRPRALATWDWYRAWLRVRAGAGAEAGLRPLRTLPTSTRYIDVHKICQISVRGGRRVRSRSCAAIATRMPAHALYMCMNCALCARVCVCVYLCVCKLPNQAQAQK